jgi:hypothetical protein
MVSVFWCGTLLVNLFLSSMGCQSPQSARVTAAPNPAGTASPVRRSLPSDTDHFGAAPSGPHMTPAKVAAWKEERALFQKVKTLYDAGRYQEAKTEADRFLSTFPGAGKRDWVQRLKRKATQKLAKEPVSRTTSPPQTGSWNGPKK